MQSPKECQFDNGVTLRLAPRLGTEAVTVMVVSRAGSMYESQSEAGIAHFLEHSVFKGTAKRDSAFAIARELDALGANYNAYTSHEYTAYVATVRKDHLRQALDMLSDIYANASLPEQELEREKGVVIEEIKMYADEPQSVAYERHLMQALGDTPAGRPIIGSIETVRALTLNQVAAFRDRWYTGHNTMVAIAGAVEGAVAEALVAEYFSDLPPGEKVSPPAMPHSSAAQVAVLHRPSDQAHTVMSVSGPGWNHADRPASRLLAKLLGGTMSSRLFQKIREDLGVAYYVGADTIARSNHGRFILYTGTDVARTAEALGAIRTVVAGLLTAPITTEELERARESMLGSMALGFESSAAIARFLANDWLRGLGLRTQDDLEHELRAVAQEDLHRYAQSLQQESWHITTVGPDTLQASDLT